MQFSAGRKLIDKPNFFNILSLMPHFLQVKYMVLARDIYSTAASEIIDERMAGHGPTVPLYWQSQE